MIMTMTMTMKPRVFSLLSLLLLVATSRAELHLQVKTRSPEQVPNMPVILEVTLKNTGPDRHGTLGLDRVNVYLFFYVSHGGSNETLWTDKTVPQPAPSPSSPDWLRSGEEKRATVELFWQPEVPVFDKAGDWTIRGVWKTPEGDLKVDTVTVKCKSPAGNEAQALRLLQDRHALPALHEAFWQVPEYSSYQADWHRLQTELSSRFPTTAYASAISNAHAKANAHLNKVRGNKP